MEIIIISILLFVNFVDSQSLSYLPLVKCCPVNFQLVFSNTTSGEMVSCRPSSESTLQVVDPSLLQVRLFNCSRIKFVSVYDKQVAISCIDRVRHLNDVFGIACDDSPNQFRIPPIFNVRKCCPPNRKYDSERQFCWNERAPNDTNAVPHLLKISLQWKRRNAFANVTFGIPQCKKTHVLVDTVMPSYQFSFKDTDAVEILYSKAADNDKNLLLSYDDFCVDMVDFKFEYLVLRSCQDSMTTCKKSGKQTCVRKCCPTGYAIPHCQPSIDPLTLTFHNISEGYPSTGVVVRDIKPAFMHGHNCKNGKYWLDETLRQEKHILTTDGTILMLATNTVIDMNSYCIDNIRDVNGSKVFICFAEKGVFQGHGIHKVKPILTSACVLISACFMLLTFLIYVLLPSLRNLHGKLIMCYLITTASGYITLVLQRSLPFSSLPLHICVVVGYLTLFTFLSSFSWLNIISYDIWSTFRAVKSAFLKKSKTNKRFIVLCMYGWGYPATLTGFAALCQFTSFIFQTPTWRPDIAERTCWFYDNGRSKILFFIVPVSVMITFNVIIFIFTVKYCANIRAELKRSNNNYSLRKYTTNKNDCPARCKKMIQNANVWQYEEPPFNLFSTFLRKHESFFVEGLIINFKLFIIMGLNWSMEIISLAVDSENRIFFIAFDLLNALQGVIVFCIFILKPKVLRDLKMKLCDRNWSENGIERTTKTTVSTTSSHFNNSSINLKKNGNHMIGRNDK